MKGRYSGAHMKIYGHILPGASAIALWGAQADNLTPQAAQRLKIVDWHNKKGRNVSLTARRFGVQRATLRRWLKRLKNEGLNGLNDRSHRPHGVRQPTTSSNEQLRIVMVRKENPTWSKYKISAYLEQQEGIKIHPSRIGRLLKRKGLINPRTSRKRKKAALNPKKRYPKGLVIKQPGDMIQIDTKYLIGIGGIKLYQYTAIDVLSKIRVLSVSTRISSRQAERFLYQCFKEFPFEIKAIQTDNGTEFMKYFDKALEGLGIVHYFTEVYSPKQNCYVERSHSTDERDFYQQGNMRSSVKQLMPLLKEWQNKYNYLRPHESLGNIPPMAYLKKFNSQKYQIPTKDYIVLQT